MPWPDLRQALDDRHANGLWRHRDSWTELAAGELIRGDKRYQVFCSNDYLGLANHPELIDAAAQAASRWGIGATASHLVNGHSQEHELLEQELAAFTGRDRALLFSTGYMANIGVITALMAKQDAVFHDRLNHASLLDAGTLSGARCRRYRHADSGSLRNLLERSDAQRRLIVTDGVFSMDGDVAPFEQLIDTAAQFDARLMIDDAHGIGVLGSKGDGCCGEYCLNQQQVPILMGTLSKAFGCFGAFVAGSEELIETLIQFARSYIYTTALPPSIAAAARTALRLIQSEPQRRQHLNQLIDEFRSQCQQLGIPLLSSNTPIQPVMVGESDSAARLEVELREHGFLVKAIRPPTVAAGSARLRVTLSAAHQSEQVAELVAALSDSFKSQSLWSQQES